MIYQRQSAASRRRPAPTAFPLRIKRWEALLAVATLAAVLVSSYLNPWGFAPGV